MPGMKSDPATRTFQAIRIHLNAELDELEQGLRAAERALRAGRSAGGGHLPQPRRPHRQALPARAAAARPPPDRAIARWPQRPRAELRAQSPSRLSASDARAGPSTRARARRGCGPQSAPMRPRGTRRWRHERARFQVGRSWSAASPARRSAATWSRCASLRNAPRWRASRPRSCWPSATSACFRPRSARADGSPSSSAGTSRCIRLSAPSRRPVRRRRVPAGDAGQARAQARVRSAGGLASAPGADAARADRDQRRRQRRPRRARLAPAGRHDARRRATAKPAPKAAAPPTAPRPSPRQAGAKPTRQGQAALRRSPSKPRRLTRSAPLPPRHAKAKSDADRTAAARASTSPSTTKDSGHANERPDARSRRTARAAPPGRTAPPDPGGDAPAADVRHAGLWRDRRADRPAAPLPRGVRRPCRAQGRRDSTSRPSAATSSIATAIRWRGRSTPGRSASTRARSSATSSTLAQKLAG